MIPSPSLPITTTTATFLSRFLLCILIILWRSLTTCPRVHEPENLARPPPVHDEQSERDQRDDEDGEGGRSARQGDDEDYHGGDDLEEGVEVDGEVGRVARDGASGTGVGVGIRVGSVFALSERWRERGELGWGCEEVEGAVEDRT